MPISSPLRPAAAIAAFVTVVLGAPLSAFAQPQSPKTDTSRGLNIEYADGQTSTSPLRRSGGMWTSTFPTITGAVTSRAGVPLTTLDVKHVVDGRDAVVTISLFYGGVGKNGVQVATVRVTPDESVKVNELRAYGVEPITLSLVPIAWAAAYAPDVVGLSAQLNVRAEAIGPNVAAYRVMITNRSRLALMWVQFKAYRGDRLAVLVRPRGKRNAPLVLPNAEYSFEITTSTAGQAAADGSETWQPLDRIEVTSLMWEDGLLEGDAAPAADQRRLDATRAAQITALLGLLRKASDQSIASLRESVARGMSSDLETRRGRDGLLEDLDAFTRTQKSRDGQDFGSWLARTIEEYEQWLTRIGSQPSRD